METKKINASPREEEASNLHLSAAAEIKNTKSAAFKDYKPFDWRTRIVSDATPPENDVLFRIRETPVIAEGNYTVITGAKKTRKSLLASHIIGNIKGKVLVCDTEQSKRHVWELRRRIMATKKCEEDVIVLHLRGMSMNEKIYCILSALNDNPQTSVIMIDNIRDLLADINNPGQSQNLIELLEYITSKYKLGMLVTIHSNKSDNKIRGHIGSELENKAFMVIKAERKTDESSEITCESSRDGDFEPFKIQHHPITGFPEVIDDIISEEKTKETFEDILKHSGLRFGELLKQTKEKFGDEGEILSESKSRKIIKIALAKKWISKIGKDRDPKSVYVLPNSGTGKEPIISASPS